jgi:hypothetical protein
MHELLSGDIEAIGRAIDSTAPEEMSREFTDTAAEVLARGFADQSSSKQGDVYLAICKALARKDVERYSAVLAKVAAESTDVRLQALAGGMGSNTAAADSYQPGSLSLEALRRKYPPLYPGIQ